MVLLRLSRLRLTQQLFALEKSAETLLTLKGKVTVRGLLPEVRCSSATESVVRSECFDLNTVNRAMFAGFGPVSHLVWEPPA